LDDRSGWMDLGNFIQETRSDFHVYVVNTPGGFNESLIENGPSFLPRYVNRFQCPVVFLFVLMRARESIEQLIKFRQTFPKEEVHVILNGVFGQIRDFIRYLGSVQKTEITKQGGKTIWLPELTARVVDAMFDLRQPIDKLLQTLPFGDLMELEIYIERVQRLFDEIFGQVVFEGHDYTPASPLPSIDVPSDENTECPSPQAKCSSYNGTCSFPKNKCPVAEDSRLDEAPEVSKKATGLQ